MTKISEMTNEQLSEALAIKVMGWHEDSDHMNLWLDKDGEITTDKEDWQPCTDLNQAVECAEAWKSGGDHRRIEITISPGWMVSIGEPKYYVALLRSNQGLASTADGNDLSRALAEAVLMAKRGEGNKFESVMKRVLDENIGAWKALADGEEGKG